MFLCNFLDVMTYKRKKCAEASNVSQEQNITSGSGAGVYQTLNLVPGEGKCVILFLQVKHEHKTEFLSEVLHARYQLVTDVALKAKIHGCFYLKRKNK